MLKPKKKIKKNSKKEIKEDKFILTVVEWYDKLKENYVQILIGVLVAVVLYFGYSYFTNQALTRNKEASIELAKANSLFMEGQESQGALVLQNLIESYGDTKSAYFAKIKLAKFYYNKDDLENAKRYYLQAIDEGNDIPYLYAAALAGYGDCLFQEESYIDAAGYYAKAAEAVDYKELKLGYELSSALSYFYAGKYDEAKAYVDKLELEKFPTMIEERKLDGLKKALASKTK